MPPARRSEVCWELTMSSCPFCCAWQGTAPCRGEYDAHSLAWLRRAEAINVGFRGQAALGPCMVFVRISGPLKATAWPAAGQSGGRDAA